MLRLLVAMTNLLVLCIALKGCKQINALWINSETQLVMPCVSNVIRYITVFKLRLS